VGRSRPAICDEAAKSSAIAADDDEGCRREFGVTEIERTDEHEDVGGSLQTGAMRDIEELERSFVQPSLKRLVLVTLQIRRVAFLTTFGP